MGDGRSGGARSGGPECPVPESGRDALEGGVGSGAGQSQERKGESKHSTHGAQRGRDTGRGARVGSGRGLTVTSW